MTFSNLSMAAGIAAATLLVNAAPAVAQVSSQHLKIDNQSTTAVTVRVLHSDGSLQKQKTINAGETDRFTFDWCYTCCGHTKRRTFELKTGSTIRATGKLTMSTSQFTTGHLVGCDGRNEMTVTDTNPGDGWNFSTSYENGHRTAVLTVNAGSS